MYRSETTKSASPHLRLHVLGVPYLFKFVETSSSVCKANSIKVNFLEISMTLANN